MAAAAFILAAACAPQARLATVLPSEVAGRITLAGTDSEAVRAAFERASDRPRLLMLLSPS